MIQFVKIVLFALALCATTAATPDVDQKAWDLLMPMTQFIENSSDYMMALTISNDATLDSGQKIELGSQVTAWIKKPRKARVEFNYRNGERATILMNGETVAIYSALPSGEMIYDEVNQPGDIDATFLYVSGVLQSHDQLKGFFAIDFTERLQRLISSGQYLGVANLSGVVCDNLALRSDEHDIQIWIRQGAKPLPHRLAVYYTSIEGQPGFRADFTDWDFNPDIHENTFVISPPPKARRIEFFPIN
jgi:hypothetical protein